MKIVKLTLDLHGEKLKPSTIKDIIKTPFKIVYLDDETNSISIIEHPIKVGDENYLLDYQKWYVDFLNKNYQLLKSKGLEHFDIFINVFHYGQCNFEIFNKELLKNILTYSVSLPISIFCLKIEQLEEILIEKGYSKIEIRELKKHEY